MQKPASTSIGVF